MTGTLAETIVRHLAAEGGGPLTVDALTRRCAPADPGAAELAAALETLRAAGRVQAHPQGGFTLPVGKDRCTGIFHGTARGFGFVTPLPPGPGEDLYIAAADTMDALTGDLVVVRLVGPRRAPDRRDRSPVGRVADILYRATNRCVGTLTRAGAGWVVIPDGALFKAPVVVRDATAKGAAADDKVVVELLEYPRGQRPAEGVISEVLGPRGEPEVELQSVLRRHDLSGAFPPPVLEQARLAAAESGAPAATNRLDFTAVPTITIDPEDARDFDDAISLQVLPSGAGAAEDASDGACYELAVHIADVSHFVPVDSPLDREARRRGNSVYFPRYVVPMLPEILSNGVCSLQEGVRRLTKTVLLRYDRQGRVLQTRLANTVIRSTCRLTYRRAQAVIDHAQGQSPAYEKGCLDSPPPPDPPVVPKAVEELLLNMDRLARAIERRRLAQGMIVLDLPEVELVMDEAGHVIDAHPEDDSYTHKIIEMFMVEANEAVARFLTENGLHVLRRIHPDPDQRSTEQVRQFIAVTGRRLPQTLDRHVVQELLDSVRGTPLAYAVHLSVLKTFSTAEYSPLPLGHYALASANYAHFTSPIRRYADLVIHRCVESVLAGSRAAGSETETMLSRRRRRSRRAAPGAAAPAAAAPPAEHPTEVFALMPEHIGNVPTYDTLLRLARHLSFTERRAQDAERELRTVKVLQLLAEHLGDVIDGVVTGITTFGLFVQSTRFLVEGLIRLPDLRDDRWRYDERSGSLRGERTGRRIALGDRARVQIVSVNVPARRMDLRLLEHGSTVGGDGTLRRVEPVIAVRSAGGGKALTRGKKCRQSAGRGAGRNQVKLRRWRRAGQP